MRLKNYFPSIGYSFLVLLLAVLLFDPSIKTATLKTTSTYNIFKTAYDYWTSPRGYSLSKDPKEIIKYQILANIRKNDPGSRLPTYTQTSAR